MNNNMSQSDSLLPITEYNTVDNDGTGFDVSARRFGRYPSRFLAFCGKNTLFLTEKAGKSQKKQEKDLPLTGCPSSRVKTDFYRGGFDGGIEVGWFGSWSESSFESLCAVLERCRRAADDKDVINSFFKIGGYVLQVSASGALVGRIKYKYVVLYHGLRIYIHSNASGNIQPIRVKIGAVPLMRHGLQKVYQLIIDLLFCFGFLPEEELVSRADCQIMSPAYTVQDFFESLSDSRFVTLSRGKLSCVASLATGKLESVTVHSRNVELCVYDKLAELATCEVTYQDSFLQCYAVDGNLPSVLTRFEFRFRSEILRNFGIKTVADLYYSSAGLLHWADTEWFRVLVRPKVRGWENKIPCCELWSQVQFYFHKVFSKFGFVSVVRSPAAKKAASPERAARLVRQAVGCLGSAVALVADSFNAAKTDFYQLAVGLIDNSFCQLRSKVHASAVELALVDGFYNKELL